MQDQVKSETLSKASQTIIQLIVFRSGNEEFSIPIENVREIIKKGSVTPIPNSPSFIVGIINVRGDIVTTIDIKKRFNLKKGKLLEPKHIIVTKHEDNLFGLMVDEVIEVLRIQNKDINPTPSVFTEINEEYIDGVVTHENRLIILLNISKILSKKEFAKFSQVVRKHKENGKISTGGKNNL